MFYGEILATEVEHYLINNSYNMFRVQYSSMFHCK